MALLDIPYVTQSIIKLIETAVNASPGWRGSGNVTVSPQPPDQVKGDAESNKLSFYLYHVSEDPYFKNQPAPGNDIPPVRYAPMGLNLHYQLTAHAMEGDAGSLLEQTMMGLAVKALHDCPLIDDSTEIRGTMILSSSLKGDGNRLRISIMPLPPQEAVSYWTAGSSPFRLAAYYEVSVILLEPEEIKTRAGRVLTYGVYPFIQGMPRLFTSKNTISFKMPGETESHDVILQPAEVTYGGDVTFKGVALTETETHLLLKYSKWNEAVEVNAAWTVVVKSEEVGTTIQTSISRPAPALPLAIPPGFYTAQVKVIDQRVMTDGSLRSFEKISNATPFTVTPKVDPLQNVINGRLDITGEYFQNQDSIEVYISDTRLSPGSYDNLNKGEFGIKDAKTMRVRLPDGFAGKMPPFRLVINGAESEPQWIKVP
jgi:hypothetical protein